MLSVINRLILVLGMFSSGILQAQQYLLVENFYDLKKQVIRERFMVQKKNPTIADSLYTSFFQNGKLKSTGIFKQGKASGNWRYFYENGSLKMEGPYKENEHAGYWKYFYENSELTMEGELYKHSKEGTWKFYFENGHLKSEGKYRKNKKIGIWVYYNEDESVKAQGVYENDRGKYSEIYPNGSLKSEGEINNGKSEGLWKYYYEDGKLKAEGVERDGQKDGLWKFYHPIGNLASEGGYTKGVAQGKWSYFHENGNVSSEGEQKHGMKEGYWKLYYSNGNFKGEGSFENGNGEYKEFYENGKIKTEGVIKNDKNDGLWKYYYESGALEGTCYYNNGAGKYVGFYPDGSLKMEGKLVNGDKEGVWKLYHENGQVAGYYKTFYENEVPVMRIVDSAIASSPKKDSLLPYVKPNLVIRKKKSRYFNEKLNEFQGFVLSAGPLGLLYRSLPLSFEYYFQERLGYEVNFTLYRSTLFMADEFIPINVNFNKGMSVNLRQKFYQPDRDRGMFYFGHELRYTRNGYFNKIVDSTVSLNTIQLSKNENKFEYSILVGNRVIKDSKHEGFTMDIFVGIGVGYRLISNSWTDKPAYESLYFENINRRFYAIPVRVGINVGYIFKNQGK